LITISKKSAKLLWMKASARATTVALFFAAVIHCRPQTQEALPATVPVSTYAELAAPTSKEVSALAPDAGAEDAGAATVNFLGRFDMTSEGAARFSWPGTAIEARFRGTSISASLDDSGWNFLDVRVDGILLPKLALKKGWRLYLLASGLTAGEHTVRLARRNEGHGGVTTFFGFENADLLAAPASPALRLEFVGDSITCGFGVDGKDPCSFEYATENFERSYAAITGRALAAEVHAIAWSGWGMLRGADGSASSNMPSIFGRTLTTDRALKWDFSSWQPHAVVIALGTNDFAKGDPGPLLGQATEKFLMKLRVLYPEAWLVLTTSPMLSTERRERSKQYFQEAKQRLQSAGDTRVEVLDLPQQTIEQGFGCGRHPSARVHEAAAEKLTSFLRVKLQP
jgi:Carbohydrate esterase 2 N-terminal/GDSL-like Lipase/Acylhydrolase family